MRSSEHLSDWILEQYAEGALSPEEQSSAEEHLEFCGRCAAELDGYRALFAALGEMPRFAPSPAFGDAVMARVKVAPAPSPVVAWAMRRLPQTPRGWSVLLGALLLPAMPVVALVAWVMSQPLVSRESIWQWTTAQTLQGSQAFLARLTEWGMGSGLFEWSQAVYTLLMSVPAGTLSAVLAVLAIGIPISTWSLVRLVRTPVERVHYAN